MAAHGALGARAGRARRILPPAAQAGRPPHASPTTCGGAGIRRPGSCSPASTPAAGRATATRSRCCPGPSPGRSSSTTPRSWPTTRTSSPSSTAYMSNGADHWFQRRHGDGARRARSRYFCAEYGLHESPRHLLRRPRRPRRRPHEDGLGHGAAADRRRADVPQGLLPPDDRRGRAPGARLPRLRARAPADPARARPARRAAHGQRPAARPRPVRRPSGSPRSAGCPVLLLDTDVPDNDDSDRPITHILYVRGREMRLHQELVLGVGGVRALRALGLDARGLAPQRGPLRVPARRARPRARRGRAGPSTTRSPRSGATACSRSTRRSPRATSASTPTSCGGSPVRCSTATGGRARAASRSSGSWSLGLGVENDPSQFDMTAFCLRMTHGANAVSQLHGHTANATWQGVSPHEILGLTNGVHTPTWLGQPMRDTLERFTNADLDAMDDQPAARRFWDRIGKVPADELWEAHQRQKLELAIFARGRLRNQFARHGEAPATLEELDERPRPEDPDDRLRPPVRDLQAIGAAVHRPRPAGPPAVGRGAPDAGHLRRQGPPRRPARPGRHPGHLRPLAQPQAPWPRVHPRGLRHPHRPVPRPGRRRLAQQPAPAARGVRARRA